MAVTKKELMDRIPPQIVAAAEADRMEKRIDAHLREMHAKGTIPHSTGFYVQNTPAEVVREIMRRYRGAGWTVECGSGLCDGDYHLQFS